MKPSELSYEDLVKLVREYFHPRWSEIVQRFHFNSRVRQSNKTIAAFVAELRKLSEFSNFGDKLDEMLRDRIVCGINHLGMQRHLLSETDLTLAKTLEVAQGLEAAEKSLKVMQEVEQKPLVTVQRIQQQKTKPIQNCYRCGGQHIAQTCFFRDKECHVCHKRGHISKMCRSGRQQQRSKQRTRKPHMQTHHVEDNNATRSDEEDTHRILRLTDSRAKPIQITVRVNKKLITMELDTGASSSMISQQTFAQIGHIRELKPSTVRLTSYSGHEIKVLGTVDVEVSYEGVQKVLPLLIVEGTGPSLFGCNWLMHFQLNWQSIQQVQQKGDLELVLVKYNLVFEKGLGKLKGTTAKIHIDPQTKLIFVKPVRFHMRSDPNLRQS